MEPREFEATTAERRALRVLSAAIRNLTAEGERILLEARARLGLAEGVNLGFHDGTGKLRILEPDAAPEA